MVQRHPDTVIILMVDYANGTGEDSVKVYVNISPKEAVFLYAKDKSGKPRKYPWYVGIQNGTGVPQRKV